MTGVMPRPPRGVSVYAGTALSAPEKVCPNIISPLNTRIRIRPGWPSSRATRSSSAASSTSVIPSLQQSGCCPVDLVNLICRILHQMDFVMTLDHPYFADDGRSILEECRQGKLFYIAQTALPAGHQTPCRYWRELDSHIRQESPAISVIEVNGITSFSPDSILRRR